MTQAVQEAPSTVQSAQLMSNWGLVLQETQSPTLIKKPETQPVHVSGSVMEQLSQLFPRAELQH